MCMKFIKMSMNKKGGVSHLGQNVLVVITHILSYLESPQLVNILL